MKYEGQVLQIVGGRSNQYPFSVYQKVFPNISTTDVVVIDGAGHWVHFDKPLETVKEISKFLQRID